MNDASIMDALIRAARDGKFQWTSIGSFLRFLPVAEEQGYFTAAQVDQLQKHFIFESEVKWA